MKKLIALILVLVMATSLFSCELVIGTNGIYINKGETTATTTTTTTTNDGGDDNPREDYTYIDFTPTEKKLYMELIGEVIPFIPNNEYYIVQDSVPSEYITTKSILLRTFGNTQEEFDAYRELFSSYESAFYPDEMGVSYYFYYPKDKSYYIAMYFVEYEGRYALEIVVSRDIKGGTAGIGTGIPYDELFTNEGAGLPSDSDGVYDLDFTKGEYIKDVTDQRWFVDGCPTTGSSSVLVIPVQFIDVTAESKGYTIDTLVNAFSKGGKTDYYSLYDYYYISSYGQLTLDITVLDFWFTPEHESDYYDQFSFMYEGEELLQGEQLILNEALDYLDDFMDLSQFDSDDNGTIDSVILVNTLTIDPTISYYWAFRYFNFYMDEEGSYYEYDNVHSKDYIWMPYQFIFEGDDENGNHIYNDTSAMNTNTFIHEFGHILGLEDYYDYSSINTPLVYDIMYHGLGDHNAYSKFNLGWITTSRLVVTDSSVTLTLEDFSKNGDTIIIANNWDDKLGAYQEYYVLVYYTNNGLNAGEGNGYFADEGVLVYHVNAAMYMQEGKDLYDVYNKNTDVTHEYGTKNNLIDYVLSADGEHVYGVGDTMPTVADDYGNELIYNFVVDEITSEYVTITFTLK
jgi:M6 family metalloprotease-like protein